MRGDGKPFEQGQSGNPAGRPKGTRNRTTLAMEAILEGEAETLTRKAIELACEGDTVALRLCMDRLAPVRKDRHVQFDLPAINTHRFAQGWRQPLPVADCAGSARDPRGYRHPVG